MSNKSDEYEALPARIRHDLRAEAKTASEIEVQLARVY